MEKQQITRKFGNIGLHSARYNAVERDGDGSYLIPIGANIRRWHLARDKFDWSEVMNFNGDLVMTLLQNSKVFVSTSYDGQSTFFTKKKGENGENRILAQIESAGEQMRIANINDKYFVNANEIISDKLGLLYIWKLNNMTDEGIEKGTFSVERYEVLEGKLVCPAIFSNNKLFYMRMSEISDSSTKTKKQSTAKVYNYIAYLYNLDEKKLEKSIAFKETISSIVSFDISETREYAAIIFLNNIVMLVNKEAEVFCKLNVGIKGAIHSIFFDQNDLYFSCKKSEIVKINMPATEKMDEINLSYKPGDADNSFLTVLRCQNSYIQKNSNFVRWVQKDKLLLSGNEDGIFLSDFEFLVHQKKTILELTACGVDVNSAGKLVAAGDFTGNFKIFSYDGNRNDVVSQGFIPGSIRSIRWINEIGLLIGTVSGELWSFNIGYDAPTPVRVGKNSLEGSITTIRTEYNKELRLFRVLCSTTSGKVYIFHSMDMMIYEQVFCSKLHLPGESCQRFGSLHIKAEVWSVAFCPYDPSLIATTSEDQTGKIWKLNFKANEIENRQLMIKDLVKHNLAVTCVDWQTMHPELGNLIAVCSDDKVMRVYQHQNDQIKLFKEIDVNDIKGFFTLTYLALEQNGTLLFCTSQKGHLFVYDLLKEKFIFRKKIHMGGIEGISLSGRSCFTCSSDNCVNITSF